MHRYCMLLVVLTLSRLLEIWFGDLIPVVIARIYDTNMFLYIQVKLLRINLYD